MSDQMIR